MADYPALAATIINSVGGAGNISNLVHCLTRLRFNLVDKQEAAPLDDIRTIEGVMGAVWQGPQLQIIIGPAVADLYAEVCLQAGIEQQTALEENLDGDPGETDRKKFSPSVIFDVFAGVCAPIVPAFAGAGVIKGMLTLLSTYGIMSPESGAYILLNAIGDSVFRFLPFVIAYTAAKKFKTNSVLALALAGVFMYPSIIDSPGAKLSILGLDITCVNYASTVLPILITVWIMSYVHAWIQKHCIDCLRVVVVPIVTLLVCGFLGLCLIGPIGYNIGVLVGAGLKGLFDIAPWLGGFIDGATRPFMIFMGIHMTLPSISINNIATLGYDMLGPAHACATMAAAGMCFGAFLKAQSTANKSAFFSSFVSAFIGITEPALYGCAFRFKRLLIALVIGGGVSGAVVSTLGAKATAFAMPSIISLPAYSTSIPQVLIGLSIAFVLTAALTYIIGFDEDAAAAN